MAKRNLSRTRKALRETPRGYSGGRTYVPLPQRPYSRGGVKRFVRACQKAHIGTRKEHFRKTEKPLSGNGMRRITNPLAYSDLQAMAFAFFQEIHPKWQYMEFCGLE